MENLDDNVDISRTWKTIKDNMETSASSTNYDLTKNFQTRQAKLQRLHNCSQMNGHNVNDVQREPMRYFRNNREYPKKKWN